MDLQHLKTAIRVAQRSRGNGNHPFGAILVDEKGNVLLEAENTVITESDCTGHAETNLVRTASQRFDAKFLAKCTLYASTEPCAMCSGAIFWSQIGRIVYALSAEQFRALAEIRPDDPFLFLSCRQVLSKGSRQVQVIGPLLEEEAKKVHDGFWR